MTILPKSTGEKLVHVVYEHWFKYVRLVAVYLLLLVISILLFYLAGLIAYHNDWLTQTLLLAALFLALLNHHWFFMALLSQVQNRIVVTSKRLIWIRDSTIFGEEMLEYSFEKMKTVSAKKTSVLQYVLQYGTLKFENGEPIPFVPHPNSVVRDIEQAMGMQ